MAVVIKSIKEFNQQMGFLYTKDKTKAEDWGGPLPSLSKYIIYNRKHMPRQTGYIAYLEDFPYIRGVGTTRELAEFRCRQAQQEYESYPLPF
jgi:hypothetical protein